jgi:hypothetical protein
VGLWSGVNTPRWRTLGGESMQKHGAYCMHKENRDYKYAEQRRDGVVVVECD